MLLSLYAWAMAPLRFISFFLSSTPIWELDAFAPPAERRQTHFTFRPPRASPSQKRRDPFFYFSDPIFLTSFCLVSDANGSRCRLKLIHSGLEAAIEFDDKGLAIDPV
jgi:hypothetical protein